MATSLTRVANRVAARAAFRAQAVAGLATSLVRSGIVGAHGGPKALAKTPEILLRYRFTTAREVEQAFHTCPERIALIDDDGVLTYGQLHALSQTFARYLRRVQGENIRLGVMARNLSLIHI